ncbi:gluconokinase [Spongiimicrobium sp. 3-5]|uniref:gluconokinase n=1 Tax=Spongiimicrobium sp. 3-5 TaxID=3332596 RepID=UPI00397FDFD8
MKNKRGIVFFVMGVSGCGKSTIGKGLAQALTIPFFDGDDYHPKSNIIKMQSGKPLNDDDRHDWLVTLNKLAHEHIEKGAVIACSALKESYRALLSTHIEEHVHWVYLKGSFDEILARLQQREGHFMPVDLLRSQFETLEPPLMATTVSINLSPKDIVDHILNRPA